MPYPSFLWILSLFVSLSLYIMTLFFSGDPKKRKKRKLHHIGFAVYEVPPHMTRLTPLYVAEHVSWCCKQILFSQLAQERIRMVWSKVSNLRSSKELFTKTKSRIFSNLMWISQYINNVWCIENRTKHSSKTLQSLVRFLMHQMLTVCYYYQKS